MNKNVKRIVSFLLCIVMVFSTFAVTGYTETEHLSPEISLECNLDEIKVGDEFEIYVTLKNVLGVENVQLMWNLNPEEIELVMVTNPFPFDFNLGTQGSYYYSFSFDEPFDGDVYVMKMVFIAKKECISTIEIWANVWNEKLEFDGFDYSIVPGRTKIQLPIENKTTTFNYTLSEENIEIGEIVEVYISLENCVDIINIKVNINFDLEYFEYYDTRGGEQTPTECIYRGDGRCMATMSVHILDDHIFGDKNLAVLTLRAVKGGTSDISVSVEEWGGKNQPEDTLFPITVDDKIYVDNFKYDVNLDGKITATDARLALRASAQIETLYGKSYEAADADSDQRVTAADARLILRKAAKLD